MSNDANSWAPGVLTTADVVWAFSSTSWCWSIWINHLDPPSNLKLVKVINISKTMGCFLNIIHLEIWVRLNMYPSDGSIVIVDNYVIEHN